MDQEWVLVFKVFDVDAENYIRNETKRSFDEQTLRCVEKKFTDKCTQMGWIEPKYKVILEIKQDITKNEI